MNDDFPISLSESEQKEIEAMHSELSPDGSPVYKGFAAKFGKDQADLIVKAADSHQNGVNNINKGADPFKWALLIAIGYECLTRPAFRSEHGITVDPVEAQKWIVENADLATHRGDMDYISLLAGVYFDWMPPELRKGKREE